MRAYKAEIACVNRVEDMAKKPHDLQVSVSNPGRSSHSETAPSGARAAAFEATVIVHLDSAYRLARYLTRRSDIAEDIVQEALLRAYRNIESQRGENVRAWLLAIVRNCFLTWKAGGRHGYRDWTYDGPEAPVEQAGGEDCEQETPESILLQLEEGSAVRSIVESLPHAFREVLVLRDIEDLSYREIAHIMEVPIGTVMSRLARARKMFAAAWKGSERTSVKEKTP